MSRSSRLLFIPTKKTEEVMCGWVCHVLHISFNLHNYTLSKIAHSECFLLHHVILSLLLTCSNRREQNVIEQKIQYPHLNALILPIITIIIVKSISTQQRQYWEEGWNHKEQAAFIFLSPLEIPTCLSRFLHLFCSWLSNWKVMPFIYCNQFITFTNGIKVVTTKNGTFSS